MFADAKGRYYFSLTRQGEPCFFQRKPFSEVFAMLAYTRTQEPRWLSWLEKVHDYAFKHFVDSKFGGRFGSCDRRGNLAHSCKGGNYKGFFHIPRDLLFCIQAIESYQASHPKDNGGLEGIR